MVKNANFDTAKPVNESPPQETGLSSGKLIGRIGSNLLLKIICFTIDSGMFSAVPLLSRIIK
jgi:hypothetical protein